MDERGLLAAYVSCHKEKMPGSEGLFNQAEGGTKWYVCKLKPDTGMWDALLNVRVRDS